MAYLNYEYMVDHALLNVVKDALEQVSKRGLREGHHFYLSFLTTYPGVELPDYIKEEYPEEITIALQHEFWNLTVTKDYFTVDINFGHKTESLKVPFKAMTHIADPSVEFELEFNPQFPQAETPVETLKPSLLKKDSSSSLPKEKGVVISLDHFRKK